MNATGCSHQWTRSSDDAWPQAIARWTGAAGLCWKKTCHLLPCRTNALGWLIQPRPGRRWKRGEHLLRRTGSGRPGLGHLSGDFPR